MYNLRSYLKPKPPSEQPQRISTLLKIAIFASLIAVAGEYRIQHRTASAVFESGGFDWQIKAEIVVWFLLGLFAAYLVIINKTVHFYFSFTNPLLWYSAFLVLALFSALYSPVPYLAVFFSMQLLVFVVLVSWFRPSMADIYLFVTIFLLMNWLGFLFLPRPTQVFSENINRFYSVFEPHANMVGCVLAIGAVGILARIVSSRASRLHLLIFLPLIFTVVFTGSRTAALGLLFGMFLALIFRRKGWLILLYVACCVFLVLLASDSPGSWLFELFTRGRSEDLATISGRIPTWSEAIQRYWEAPMLGKGYRSARVLNLSGVLTGSDSMVLDALLQLGLLGFICLVGVFGTFLYGTLRLCLSNNIYYSSRGLEILAMAIPVLANSATSTLLAGRYSHTVVVTVALLWVFNDLFARERRA